MCSYYSSELLHISAVGVTGNSPNTCCWYYTEAKQFFVKCHHQEDSRGWKACREPPSCRNTPSSISSAATDRGCSTMSELHIYKSKLRGIGKVWKKRLLAFLGYSSNFQLTTSQRRATFYEVTHFPWLSGSPLSAHIWATQGLSYVLSGCLSVCKDDV